MERVEFAGIVRIPPGADDQDGWVVLTAECKQAGNPALAFRVVVRR
jgi:hypothetical protein